MPNREWYTTDFYAVLDVPATATGDEIQAAFYAIARANHPDLAPDDVAAHERFKAASAAHQVLGDPTLRGAYDRFRNRLAQSNAQVAADRAAAGGGGVPLAALSDFDRSRGRRIFRIVSGWVVIALGIALASWVLFGSGGEASPGQDSFGRTITLLLVAVKFMIAGVIVLLYPGLRSMVRAHQRRNATRAAAAATRTRSAANASAAPAEERRSA
jgi:hypothetical protein